MSEHYRGKEYRSNAPRKRSAAGGNHQTRINDALIVDDEPDIRELLATTLGRVQLEPGRVN